jgi:hypothetical protein
LRAQVTTFKEPIAFNIHHEVEGLQVCRTDKE